MTRNVNYSLAALAVAAVISTPASATNGYFAIGYGAKAMGVAGAGVAFAQDSLAAASNPAGIIAVGNRADLGVRFFNPNRSSTLDVNAAFGSGPTAKAESGADLFLVGGGGFAFRFTPAIAVGFSMYGNGGMNTRFDRNIFDETAANLGFLQAFGPPIPPGIPGTGGPDTGTLGVDLAQLIMSPNVAYKVSENHTLGASLLIGVQRFRAYGLGNFQCFTGTAVSTTASQISCGTTGFPTEFSDGLTNQGNDYGYGAGLRVGWLGELSDAFSIGVSAATKIDMTKMDKYDELFAESGNFDIPPNWTVGFAFKPTDATTIALDVQQILYEEDAAVSNVGPVPSPTGPAIGTGSGTLGSSNGLGFGWKDMTVYKLGIAHDYSDSLTLRAGFNYGEGPIEPSQVLFNVIAPGVVEKHVTVGFTYSPSRSSELSVAFMHAFEETVTTNLTAFNVPGKLEMDQNSLDLSYSWKF